MKDPIPTFSYLVSEIAKRYPDFAYLHVIEPRVSGGISEREVPEGEVNKFLSCFSNFSQQLSSLRATIS